MVGLDLSIDGLFRVTATVSVTGVFEVTCFVVEVNFWKSQL